MFFAWMVSGRPFHSSNWRYDIMKVILLYNVHMNVVPRSTKNTNDDTENLL